MKPNPGPAHPLPGIMALVLAAGSMPWSPALAQAQAQASPSVPAYYVADFEATVPGAIQPYSEQVESSFKPYGGRFIVRGGQLLPLEGTAPKGRLIVIAFDSLERAQAWYRSPAYERLKPIRWAAGKTNVYIVEGSPDLAATMPP